LSWFRSGAKKIALALILSYVSALFIACVQEAETTFGSHFGAVPPDAYKRLGKGAIGALAFSPDAEHFVVGSEVGLFNYRTEPVEEVWSSPTTAGVNSVAYDPEGRILAVGLRNQVLILIDAATGQPLPDATALRIGEVTSLAWSPSQAGDRRLLAVGFRDGSTSLLHFAEGEDSSPEIIHTLGPARGGVTSLAFSPMGDILAVGDSNGGLTLWDPQTGQSFNNLSGHGTRNPVTAFLWDQDGGVLISGGKGGMLIAWDVNDGTIRNEVKAYPDAVEGLGWLAGEGIFQSISADGELQTWDSGLTAVGEGQILVEAVVGSAWSSDGGLHLVGSETENVSLWETRTEARNELLASLVGFNAPGEVASAVAWSEAGDRLAAAHGEKVYVWMTSDLQDESGGNLGAPAVILDGHEGSDTAIAWAPDGKTLATGARDRTVILWDPESGEALQQLEGHENSIWSVAWSPDGERLASTGGLDDTLIIWDARTGEQLAELPGDTFGLFGLAWSPDGGSLAAGTGYGRVLIWDVSGDVIENPYASWFGHLSWVGGISWTPDGQNLASSSADRTIVVWDAAQGSKQHTLTGHTDAVLDVAFGASGERLASASADGLVIVWEILQDTAKVLPGHTQAVGGVDWSPENVLASGSTDGTVIIWDTDRPESD
jgi:WD40 repeat protein